MSIIIYNEHKKVICLLLYTMNMSIIIYNEHKKVICLLLYTMNIRKLYVYYYIE